MLRARRASLRPSVGLALAFGTGIVAQTAENKGVHSQSTAAAQTSDDDFARPVKRMDHAARLQQPPGGSSAQGGWRAVSPKDVLGHHIGEPKKLTYYADILKYYRALAAKTPRVKIDDDRQEQRRPRARRRVRRLGRIDQEPRAVPRPTWRSSPIRAGSPRRRRRQIVAKAKPIYHLIGRAAQRRGRAVGDADGARLPPRHRGLAARQRRSATT